MQRYNLTPNDLAHIGFVTPEKYRELTKNIKFAHALVDQEATSIQFSTARGSWMDAREIQWAIESGLHLPHGYLILERTNETPKTTPKR